ncbi:MAG: HD domain-containing protein [Clostridia bacterium]|nr:HD domain-containing protein [Clostridia bacterium]
MKSRNYERLSPEIAERIRYDKEHNCRPNLGAVSANAKRRIMNEDVENEWRSAYIRDVDKIMHSPYYNRYTDKTQVFSFYKNDDITRRALHVQLVSRIARTIGSALNLNLNLIEAIALGHDIGHTPFGHAGERFLSEVYHAETGRYFNHNVHSLRVLDGIFPLNMTLDTLNGIITHNGEFEMHEYRPEPMDSFDEFDKMVESCYVDEKNILKIVPSTLEGCVVRVCDIIAYLGKDRQDAIRANLIESHNELGDGSIGTVNQEIINNLMVNIIENSYGKPYIMLDNEHYMGLKHAKRVNYEQIYHRDNLTNMLDNTVKPMIQRLYMKLLSDLKEGKKSSPIFEHHIDFVTTNYYAPTAKPYLETEPNQIVVDYIASMTDDYCAELYKFLFPKSSIDIEYHGYFETLDPIY